MPVRLDTSIPDSLKYTAPETKIMELTSAAGSLKQVAEENGISHKELQWYNPWIKGYKLPANKLCHLMLPVKK
jgi:hypothetical protein